MDLQVACNVGVSVALKILRRYFIEGEVPTIIKAAAPVIIEKTQAIKNISVGVGMPSLAATLWSEEVGPVPAN